MKIKIILAIILLSLTNCKKNDNIQNASKIEENAEELANKVIHSWEVPDKFKLTINSLKIQDVEIKKLKSEFSYKKSEMVVMLTYTYENLSKNIDDEILLQPFYLKDEKDEVSEIYTPIKTKLYPKSIKPGEKITVQIPYGIKNKSDKLQILFDSYIIDKVYETTFEVEVEK